MMALDIASGQVWEIPSLPLAILMDETNARALNFGLSCLFFETEILSFPMPDLHSYGAAKSDAETMGVSKGGRLFAWSVQRLELV